MGEIDLDSAPREQVLPDQQIDHAKPLERRRKRTMNRPRPKFAGAESPVVEHQAIAIQAIDAPRATAQHSRRRHASRMPAMFPSPSGRYKCSRAIAGVDESASAGAIGKRGLGQGRERERPERNLPHGGACGRRRVERRNIRGRRVGHREPPRRIVELQSQVVEQIDAERRLAPVASNCGASATSTGTSRSSISPMLSRRTIAGRAKNEANPAMTLGRGPSSMPAVLAAAEVSSVCCAGVDKGGARRSAVDGNGKRISAAWRWAAWRRGRREQFERQLAGRAETRNAICRRALQCLAPVGECGERLATLGSRPPGFEAGSFEVDPRRSRATDQSFNSRWPELTARSLASGDACAAPRASIAACSAAEFSPSARAPRPASKQYPNRVAPWRRPTWLLRPMMRSRPFATSGPALRPPDSTARSLHPRSRRKRAREQKRVSPARRAGRWRVVDGVACRKPSRVETIARSRRWPVPPAGFIYFSLFLSAKAAGRGS